MPPPGTQARCTHCGEAIELRWREITALWVHTVTDEHWCSPGPYVTRPWFAEPAVEKGALPRG